MALLMLGVFRPENDREAETIGWLAIVRPGLGGVARARPAGGPADAVRRRLRGRRLRPLHEGADPRRPAPARCSCPSTTCARPRSQKFEYPVLVLLATAGMMMMISANDLIALYLGPRAAEPGALRGGRHPPRRRALERGGPQVFRAGRAVVGHAALRRLADLRLHRLDQLRRHRRRRQGDRRRPGHRPDLRPGVPAGRPRLQDLGRAVPHVDARRLRGRADAGHRLLRRRAQGRRHGAADARDARRLRRHRPAVAAGGERRSPSPPWGSAPSPPSARPTSSACSPTRPSATSAMR